MDPACGRLSSDRLRVVPSRRRQSGWTRRMSRYLGLDTRNAIVASQAETEYRPRVEMRWTIISLIIATDETNYALFRNSLQVDRRRSGCYPTRASSARRYPDQDRNGFVRRRVGDPARRHGHRGARLVVAALAQILIAGRFIQRPGNGNRRLELNPYCTAGIATDQKIGVPGVYGSGETGRHIGRKKRHGTISAPDRQDLSGYGAPTPCRERRSGAGQKS